MYLSKLSCAIFQAEGEGMVNVTQRYIKKQLGVNRKR